MDANVAGILGCAFGLAALLINAFWNPLNHSCRYRVSCPHYRAAQEEREREREEARKRSETRDDFYDRKGD